MRKQKLKKRLNNFPKLTYLVYGKAGIWNQVMILLHENQHVENFFILSPVYVLFLNFSENNNLGDLN